MPQIVIAPNVLQLEQRDTHTVPCGTSLAAFAAQRHPGRVARLFVNGCEVDDAELAQDDVAFVSVQPAEPISAFFAALTGWQAVLAAVAVNVSVSLVINALFRPKKPSAANMPNASPVYGIGATQNMARLGAPVPVIYGEVVCVPDYAAQPVAEFVDNEQFLYSLLCIGQGEFDVMEMFIGDSSASNIDPAIASWQVIPPGAHRQTFGIVSANYGIPENTYTSPEVADQELVGPPAVPTPVGWYWKYLGVFTDSTLPAGAQSTLPGGLATETHADLGAVRSVYLSSMGDSGHTYKVYVATLLPPGGAIQPQDVRVNDIPGPGGDSPVGAFEMCKPGQIGTEAALDFVFPGGLFKQDNTGNVAAASVKIEVTFTPIGNDGSASGHAYVYEQTFTASTPTPQRYTHKYTLNPGRYTCKVRRLTLATTGDLKVADRVQWTGLKFRLGHPSGSPVYGEVTLVGVKLKATNGVSGSSANQLRFRVRRKLAPLGNGQLAATRNPADALVDILTAPYGGGRPVNDAELDLAAYTVARKYWSTHNGFNAIFDRPGTVWEAMTLALQTVAAVPLPIGQRIGVAMDGVKNTRMAVFTDHNVVADSMQIQYEFAKLGDPQAVRVEYRDPARFQVAYVTEPPAEEYNAGALAINLFGCTDREVARQHAVLQLNRKRLQRKSIAFETELEGMSVRHGDRIAVAHSLPDWGTPLVLLSVLGRLLHFDRPLTWAANVAHAVMLRDVYGQPHVINNVMPGLTIQELVLPSDPPFDLMPLGSPQEPTIAAFGPLDTVLTDWVITSMEPAGDYRVRVSAVAYNPEIYNGAMPHQGFDPFGTPDVNRIRWVIGGKPQSPSADLVIAGKPHTPSANNVVGGRPAFPADTY